MQPIAPTRIRKQQNERKLKTTWTAEEDDLLRSLVSTTQPNSWSAIAKYFPTKTAPQISGRWEKVLNPRLVKGGWTREEDEVIGQFVKENGTKAWAKLALLLNGRTGKQCRERFKNHLDPDVMRRVWTADEDRQLINLHREVGNQWTRIASLMNGRTDNCIKNRWNSTVKKRLERMESGQPLVQKRGRRPKSQSKLVKTVSVGQEPPSSPCASPTPQVIETAHLSTMLLARRPRGTNRILSLAENRLDFQRLLSNTP
jgi:hypothetical protein